MSEAKPTCRSLFLFGATGPTGLQVLNQALVRGFHVTALVRNPERLKVKHENLNVVIGDATDRSTFNEAMKGKDAVISCLGAKYQFFGSIDLYSRSGYEIHQSMKENGVKRAMFMSSWFTKLTSDMSFFYRWVFAPLLGVLLDDLKRREDYLETKGTEIDYTVIRPPGLVNTAMTGGEFIVKENSYFIEGNSGRIARADVARFMLNSLETDKYKKKMIALGMM